nr:elongation factor P [Tanacetum cinerariifolium]
MSGTVTPIPPPLVTNPEFLHVKLGKGKNHITGNSVEKTFCAGSKIEPVNISKKTKQFTYKDGSQLVFMDL